MSKRIQVTVYATLDQREGWRAKAKAESISLAAWCARTLDREAGQEHLTAAELDRQDAARRAKASKAAAARHYGGDDD